MIAKPALYVRIINMKRNKGFSLVEIMFVVLVISLLISLAVVQGIKFRKMANEANAQANLRGIAGSFEIYAAGHAGAAPQQNFRYRISFDKGRDREGRVRDFDLWT